MAKIGNVEIADIVSQYPTPLYVYDEEVIREKISQFQNHFVSEQFETEVIYASKAFSCKAMCRLIQEYHMGLDVVSGGEMYTALKAGFEPSRMYFHGNNKTLPEIRMAIREGVGTIVADNLQEVRLLSEIAKAAGHMINVLLRVNPGVEAHTHQYIVTAHVDSKFGISLLEEDTIIEAIRIIENSDCLSFMGLHAHIGSQIFDEKAYVAEIEKLFAFSEQLLQKGIRVRWLNFGGGFAAVYTDEDQPIPVERACRTIVSTCEKENALRNTGVEKIMIEPGRSIVAEAGYTLYTVGFTKETPNRKYIFADGGMSDNIRPALYQAKYSAFINGKETLAKDNIYTVAGKCCESGDILIDEIALPHADTGDTLVVCTTGAYGYSMASNYNKQTFPAVLFAENGKLRELIRAQTYEDLIEREI